MLKENADLPLHNHIAIISGAMGDIGRAIAHGLAACGAAVALGDIVAPEAAQLLLDELARDGFQVRYDCVDVSDASAVNRWVEAVENEWGAPNLIIPNAAIVTLADIQTVTPEQWQRELNINLSGAFHLAQAGALRLLHHKRAGRIVFVGSWAAHAPHPHIPAYSVAKAGLRMLMKCMALDLAPHDILVNEVAPGYVDAGLSGRLFQEQEERREQARNKVPIHRLISAADVAFQVAHLCHPENRHTTGSVLLMDGGLSLRS
jgi:NAD(P)-dependent dehydrogenase (short-subunit alcohol dehydrogenase family)